MSADRGPEQVHVCEGKELDQCSCIVGNGEKEMGAICEVCLGQFLLKQCTTHRRELYNFERFNTILKCVLENKCSEQ